MEPTIRPYRESDHTAFVVCMEDFQDYVGSIDPLGRIRLRENFDGEAYVANLLQKVEKQHGAIFIAEADGNIIGLIAGIIQDKSVDDLLEIFPTVDGMILELYLQKEWRGKSLGRQLMETMESYFRQKQCATVVVGCFGLNVDAHTFYCKLGYHDRHIEMMKVL